MLQHLEGEAGGLPHRFSLCYCVENGSDEQTHLKYKSKAQGDGSADKGAYDLSLSSRTHMMERKQIPASCSLTCTCAIWCVHEIKKPK